MKNLHYITGIIVLLVSQFIISGCGKVYEEKNEIISDPAEIELESESASILNDNEENENIEDDDETDYINALDYIKSIIKINKYSDGKYIASGVNQNGDSFVGILHRDGNMKIFEDYSNIIPLKDGRLFVTNEEIDTKKGYLKKTAVNGSIIDEREKIIFSDSQNFRYIPVTEDRIIVFNCVSEFEGIKLELGMIDADGNWIYELSSENKLAKLLTPFAKTNSDETWNFDRAKLSYYSFPLEAYIEYDESGITFYIGYYDRYFGDGRRKVNERAYTYIYNLDSILEYKDGYDVNSKRNNILGVLSNNNLVIQNSGWSLSSGAGHRTYYTKIETLEGQEIYNIDMFGFYIGEDYLYIEGDFHVIWDLVSNKIIELSESVYSHIYNIFVYKNEVYILLKGEDGQYYLMKPNDDKPSKMRYYKQRYNNILFYDKYLVYYGENSVCIMDNASFDIMSLIEVDNEIEGISKLDEETFSVQFENNLHIYDIDGNLLY